MNTNSVAPNLKKRSKIRSIAITLILCVILIAVLGGLKFWQISQAIAEHGSFKPPKEGVSTISTVKVPWQDKYRVAGVIKATNGVLLKSEEPGIVKHLHFKAGELVEKGKLLVELDVSVEEAQLNAALAKLELASNENQRSQELLKQKAASKAVAQSAVSEYNQAKADVMRLRAIIAKKSIVAPFAGTVGIQHVEVGQYVSVGSNLVELHNLSQLEVDFAVPQNILPYLNKGSVIDIAVENPNKLYKATVSGADPVADTSTLTVRHRALLNSESLANSTNILYPGMFVKVEVPASEKSSLVVLPTSAISYAPYGNSVFMVEKKGDSYIVKSTIVRVGTPVGDNVPVLSGIKEGVQVVTAGVFKLREGIEVVINNAVPAKSDPLLPNT